MQPRVFVSSTYYDLKYVRDRIELFLKRFSFEPVLFESDKVTFEHNKPLDSSCYDEVRLCHMFILIVGGRYGSPSTSHRQEEFQKRYEDEFISITRKEYETAVKNNMPTFIFIDKNVYSEYQTFKKNQVFFEKIIKEKKIENKEFSFAHVDNQNVFYFIDLLQQKAIKQFDTVDEIENYLSSQFSGMFFLYLKQLQETASNQKIIDTINELNTVVNRMNTMVDGIGKEVIKQPGELEEINKKQFEVIARNFSQVFSENEIMTYTKDDIILNDTQEEIIADIFCSEIIFSKFLNEFLTRRKKEDKVSESTRIAYKDIILNSVNTKLSEKEISLIIEDIDLDRIARRYNNELKPFIDADPNNKDILKYYINLSLSWVFL
jgi:hypothetical protein